MARFIDVKMNGQVLEVTLDRPPANAITPELGRELREALLCLQEDPNLRAAILTGTGDRIFCAGWDLKAVALETDAGSANDAVMNEPGGFAGITEMWERHKPLIAAINGVAVGGGFEMALAADIIIAVEHAEFFLPEMERGFVPDAGAIQRLPRLVPYNVAMEMMLTGRRMTSSEAVHWGLVHAAVPSADLMPMARSIAEKVAKGAPLAVEALLEVVPSIHTLPIEEAFARTKRGQSNLPTYERMLNSEDFLEGPRAFAEKREPVWKGR